jgi:hypothetical protein
MLEFPFLSREDKKAEMIGAGSGFLRSGDILREARHLRDERTEFGLGACASTLLKSQRSSGLCRLRGKERTYPSNSS